MPDKRLSPNARKAIIFEGTSPANTAFDTGILNTQEWDAITVRLAAVGGTFAAVGNSFDFFDSDGVAMPLAAITLTAGASFAFGSVHPGASSNSAQNGGAFFNSHVPERLRYSVAALGAGVSARITVLAAKLYR